MKKRLIPALLYLFIFQIATVYADEPAPPELRAASAVLIDADTGVILYGKEAHAENFPASVTKVMTALLTLEQCEDLTQPLAFSRAAVFSLPPGASHIAMDEGETLTLYDALHGLLLSSANEVANALAEHVAGSPEDFALLMNKRARALGAVNTHFANPSGLHDDAHTTTAYDMALIMNAAVKHPVFNEIIAKRRYDIPPTEKQARTRELLNTNRIIHPGPQYNERVIGGKTGYTDEARHTLLTYARHEGRGLIAAVMNGERPGAYDDTNALYAYGFALPYAEQLVLDGGAYRRVVPVFHEDAQIGEITLKAAADLTYKLPVGFDRGDLRYEADCPTQISPPVLLGDELGTVTCYIQDKKIGEVALTAADAVFAPVSVATDPAAASQTEPVMAMGTAALDALDETTDAPPVPPPAWETAYILTLAVPLAVSATSLAVAALMLFNRRRRRKAQILQFDRYARRPRLYRIK